MENEQEKPTVSSPTCTALLCCDHDWELKDESFNHEFGCEQVQYYECVKCEKTKDLEAVDYDPFLDLDKAN